MARKFILQSFRLFVVNCTKLESLNKELEVHFNNEGDIEGILESYIERSIESLKIDQREPAVCLVARMITPSIKRKIISRNELLNLVANEQGISSTLLSKTMYNLEQGTNLIRRVPSYRDYYYEIGFNEIADELLFGWIQKKFQKRTEKKKLVETKRGFWIASYLIVLNLLLIFALIKIWHKKIPSEADEERAYSPEILYLLIVVLTGALGNSIHSAWKFINDVSNRRIFQIWNWSYVLGPFVGMGLAIIVYFGVRGGLIMSTGNAEDLNPYGVAAIAALAGMFSKQVVYKLRGIFNVFFRTENTSEQIDKLGE